MTTARKVIITALEAVAVVVMATMTQIGLTALTGSRDAGHWMNLPVCFALATLWAWRRQKRFGPA